MKISVIIPTLNEEENIGGLISFLTKSLTNIESEIIVVDGNSSDSTQSISKEKGAIIISTSLRNRAVQMNKGAKIAKGETLYFVHADSLPPATFFEDITTAFDEGCDLGCFRFKFDSNRFLLAMNSYFTRFDRMMCRGGDQTLFIKKQIFEELGGYIEDYRIMEEYEFIKRAREKLSFKIIPKDVLVSARKYENNSYLRVNLANFIVFTLFRFGASQESMIKVYRTLLNHPKAESLK